MEPDDPFASITELCHVSSSQEELLRRRRFAGKPEVEEEKEETKTQVSGEIEEQLTGIMMVTPSESPQDKSENDNNTPKCNENPQIASSDDRRDDPKVVVEEETEGEGEKTVDLGVNTELGSGSVNEVIQSELNKVRVLKRELAASEFLIESLKKKSKISDSNLCSESPKRCLGESVKTIIKSMEKLNSEKDGPYNSRDKGPQSSQNSQASRESSAKRKLDFSTENLGLETEDLGFSEALDHSIRNNESGILVCNNRNGEGTSNLVRKSVEDIDKFRYTGPSACNSSEVGRTQAIRTLPVSISGKGEQDARKDNREITLLDILRMLARKCDYDLSLESISILDVAKSRGMTFP